MLKWKLEFDNLLLDELHGTTFACLITGIESHVDKAKTFAVLWVDLAENKRRIARLPPGVKPPFMAGNSDLTTLTLLLQTEILTISAVDIDAVDQLASENSGHVSHNSDVVNDAASQTFSLSSRDAFSRTITMPHAPRWHWDNIDRRWLDEQQFLQLRRSSAELDDEGTIPEATIHRRVPVVRHSVQDPEVDSQQCSELQSEGTLSDAPIVHRNSADVRSMEDAEMKSERYSSELDADDVAQEAAEDELIASEEATRLSDPFENAAHFPQLQRRLTSRKPCFFRDCWARNVEQVKELSQL